MKIYAIGDLHLPGGNDNKSMHVFGDNWKDHFLKISNDWESRVKDDDIILLPGDISWALKFEDAVKDLNDIASLKGIKVFLKGNHDFWWSSLTKLKSIFTNKMYFIQNNSIEFDNFIIGGTRGWLIPTNNNETSELDIKIYNREINRLRMSLNSMKNLNKRKIVMMHFPPVFENYKYTEFSKILSEYAVEELVYGHIHGEGIASAFNGKIECVKYSLVSADALNFKLKEII